MSVDEVINKVLVDAVYAPSGDNMQPWEFGIDKDELVVFNIPEKDSTVYNFRQRGSYISHGALIENISILSVQYGYIAAPILFPGEKEVVARIRFVPADIQVNSLSSVIAKRSTNRKPYKCIPLEENHRKALLDAGKTNSEVELHLIETPEHVREMAQTLSFNEELLMECRALHDFLFSIIRWSASEEQEHPGLYIKTMEFPAPVRFLFAHVLPHWPIVRVLNLFGFSKSIAKQSATGYAASSAFGILTIKTESNQEFIEAGRAFQRIWLTAVNAGLSVQPVTALPYLMQRVVAGEAQDFNQKQIQGIQEANKSIRNLAGLSQTSSVAMIFRIGYGDEPSAQSSKMKPIFRNLI